LLAGTAAEFCWCKVLLPSSAHMPLLTIVYDVKMKDEPRAVLLRLMFKK